MSAAGMMMVVEGFVVPGMSHLWSLAHSTITVEPVSKTHYYKSQIPDLTFFLKVYVIETFKHHFGLNFTEDSILDPSLEDEKHQIIFRSW